MVCDADVILFHQFVMSDHVSTSIMNGNLGHQQTAGQPQLARVDEVMVLLANFSFVVAGWAVIPLGIAASIVWDF